jgi:fructose-1,6-bisphosphatase/inositol monophosphatase family enzyme
MDVGELLEVCRAAAEAVHGALAAVEDWGLAGTRPGQYLPDLAADTAVVEVLTGAGLGVLSEESGLHEPSRPLLAVVDPLDGSTNASRGIPWYGTSICVLDADGPLVAVVRNQVSGVRYEATRDGGATRDGQAIVPSGETSLGAAIVGLSGYPPAYLGWKQYRALGAVALDLCAVADGTFDGYVDCARSAHGPWDYLGGALVCGEAGGLVGDALGRDLVVRVHGERRTPIAAATRPLYEDLLARRRAVEPGSR